MIRSTLFIAILGLANLAIIAKPAAAADLADVQTFLQAGDITSAQATLALILVADPDNIEAHDVAALLAEQTQDFERAVSHLREILSRDRYDDRARLRLSHALWRLHAAEESTQVLNEVLERHPKYAPALTLKGRMDSDPSPEGPSAWKMNLRGELSAGYDSNMSMVGTDVPNASEISAYLVGMDAAVAIEHASPARPITVLGRVNSRSTLDPDDEAADFAPSSVQLAVIGRHNLGYIQGELDLRYNEYFSNLFETHRMRQIKPSVSASYPVLPNNRVRLLLGAALNTPFETLGFANNQTFELGLRDTHRAGTFRAILDLKARVNQGDTNADSSPWLTDYRDLGGSLYLSWRPSSAVELFAMGMGQQRTFDEGLEETTANVLTGLRYTFDSLEVHAEYGYTQNDSNTERSYERLQISGGVRFWY